MNHNLKAVFDSIHAEEKLIKSTQEYLKGEILKRKGNKLYVFRRNLVVILSSLTVFFLSGMFTFYLYFTPDTYVDVDVNPSIEISINRFNRVVDVNAYNLEGEGILSGLAIKHKNYKEAVIILLSTIEQMEYIQNGSLLSVTLQTGNEKREKELLDTIKDDITSGIYKKHSNLQIDVFPVSQDTRTHAHEFDISPAKYLAILELMEVSREVTIEGCKGHSVSEIKKMTQEHEHEGNHHGGRSGNGCHTY